MDEYISKTKFEELMRKKARNNFDLYYADGSKHYHARAIGYTIAADEAHVFPTADVQPIVYAHKTINVGRRSYCSNCGKLAIMEDFCSKCGAKVKDGEQNES